MLEGIVEAIQNLGFEEKPNSKIVVNDLDFQKRNRWICYAVESGDMKGTALFMITQEMKHFRAPVIVFPSKVQGLYHEQMRSLEEDCGISYFDELIRNTDYSNQVKHLLKSQMEFFGLLIKKAGINPIDDPNYSRIETTFNFEYFMTTHPSDEREFGKTISLALTSKYSFPSEAKYYVDFFQKMPERMDRLLSMKDEWLNINKGIRDYVDQLKSFYDFVKS